MSGETCSLRGERKLYLRGIVSEREPVPVHCCEDVRVPLSYEFLHGKQFEELRVEMSKPDLCGHRLRLLRVKLLDQLFL